MITAISLEVFGGCRSLTPSIALRAFATQGYLLSSRADLFVRELIGGDYFVFCDTIVNMIQVCIDESGDIGYSKKSSKYFIMCAISTSNLDLLRRIARRVHKRKCNKKKANALHAYAENQVTKNKLVKKLALVDMKCVACVVKKEKIQVADLYLYTTERIAEHFANKNVEIIIVAKRDTRKSYNQNILNIYASHNIKATFSDPTKEKSLQIADFYSWSIFSKFEKNNDVYFEQLSKNIDII